MFESKIFKNEEVLFPDYLPEFLPYREEQIKEVAKNLIPASEFRKPQNTFIFGPSGIGKTAVAKFIFREFEQYSGIKTIYINCWDYKTSISILSKIAIELGAFIQRRGVGKDEIFERMIEACKKSGRAVIVCLDEVDQVVFKDQEILYDLLRIDQYIKNPFGLIFISNTPNIFINLDQRIKSSLNLEEIEFKPYRLEEMKKILEERIKFAFHSVEEGVALIAANHAVNLGGDVRIGLECLLKAGRLAEMKNSEKLKVEHIKEVLPSVGKFKPRLIEEWISDAERKILEIVSRKKSFFSGELYSTYRKEVENPVSERMFREYVNHLSSLGLIKVIERRGG
ncbi:MAG: AAA family ATPase, partial [Candidatus Aenigmatarchaeota archaeon]